MTLVKLTEKQKKLVDTLVATGDSIKNCAKLAGYSEGEAGRVSASKALKTPHVQQYMMTAIADSMSIHATKALSRIVNLSSNAKSEYVSLEASKDLLDRAGFKAPDKVMHSIPYKRSCLRCLQSVQLHRYIYVRLDSSYDPMGGQKLHRHDNAMVLP